MPYILEICEEELRKGELGKNGFYEVREMINILEGFDGTMSENSV